MEIGTIGAGAFAQAFAQRALKGGPLAGRDFLERGES